MESIDIAIAILINARNLDGKSKKTYKVDAIILTAVAIGVDLLVIFGR